MDVACLKSLNLILKIPDACQAAQHAAWMDSRRSLFRHLGQSCARSLPLRHDAIVSTFGHEAVEARKGLQRMRLDYNATPRLGAVVSQISGHDAVCFSQLPSKAKRRKHRRYPAQGTTKHRQSVCYPKRQNERLRRKLLNS